MRAATSLGSWRPSAAARTRESSAGLPYPGTGALVEVLANLSKIRNVSLKSPFSGHQSLFDVFLYI
jgi:hypothetical protein